ncbi:DUF1254 domain-containing protein [Adhaeretor mobilis]|uniref:DUF1254 domain-containing protein n=1 Tax=Adhaeretor mobilis TaxID=1930276 RepID=A0A517MXJ6_9BACT|nr:DUF1254 domain-containing protein [Adhaeretor mobilis]QDS99608.1 hypothetical protein HG15A2_29340 [Adhaeretor mobilis]
MKMRTPIPESITTPAKIETRLGTLEFPQGNPTDRTAEKVYEHLDFMHGVEAFLYALPGASVHAAGRGIKSQGGDNQTVLIIEQLMDSRSLFLTASTESIYSMMWLDLKEGPLVIESPPNILGIVNDHWFRYVGDIGNAGPDQGKGGKYLLLPPGYKDEVPAGYFVLRSATYQNLYFWRGFIKDGSTATAVENTKKFAKVYPLADAKTPPPMKYIDVSGKYFNTIGGNDFSFFEDIKEIVQSEPNDAYSPEILGMLAAIGIEKGKPFNPDEKLKQTLSEAVAVGNATARTIAFKPWIRDAYLHPGSAWFFTFVGGSYQFLSHPGVRNLAARDLFHYNYTGITSAMAFEMVGIGSKYVFASTDSEGRPLEGAKTYKIELPPNIPAKDFWSFVVYDNQTRSMLQTDQQFPSLGSKDKDIVINADGSVDVWFGPTVPKGHENNLGPDCSRRGLGCAVALVWTREELVRQVLEAGRVRTGEITTHKKGTTMKRKLLNATLALSGAVTLLTGYETTAHAEQDAPTLAEMRAIAKEAYIYGYPLVDNYRVQYAYYVDEKNPNFKAPWNHLKNIHSVFTPADTSVQTPNSDTPYSWAGLDLRAEPIVISVPAIEKERYYDVEIWDAYTFIVGYAGSRTTGNDAGSFMLVGPGWKGVTPKGIKKVYVSDTDFGVVVIRTQLFNPADIDSVKKIQAQYKMQPLSEFLGTTPPPAAPAVDFIKPLAKEEQKTSLEFFNIMNFVLTYSPTVPSEVDLRERFAKIGIEGGKTFDPTKLSPEMKTAIEQGRADAWQAFAGGVEELDEGKITSGDVFGSREFLKDNYLNRWIGTIGIYGNAKEEAMYPVYRLDSAGNPLSGANKYTLHFAAGEYPPVNAFWSLTMYDLPQSLLVANPINRYLINSPMLPQMNKDADGGLTIYIQNESPGKDKESNWLPAPKGPFAAYMRLYWPKQTALDGSWKQPKLEEVK